MLPNQAIASTPSPSGTMPSTLNTTAAATAALLLQLAVLMPQAPQAPNWAIIENPKPELDVQHPLLLQRATATALAAASCAAAGLQSAGGAHGSSHHCCNICCYFYHNHSSLEFHPR
jgi:hypothetical protein